MIVAPTRLRVTLGGDGFLTFHGPGHHSQFRETMHPFGIREMRHRFHFEGSQALADF